MTLTTWLSVHVLAICLHRYRPVAVCVCLCTQTDVSRFEAPRCCLFGRAQFFIKEAGWISSSKILASSKHSLHLYLSLKLSNGCFLMSKLFFFLLRKWQARKICHRRHPQRRQAQEFGIPQGFAATASKSKLKQHVVYSFVWKKWRKSSVYFTQGHILVNPT